MTVQLPGQTPLQARVLKGHAASAGSTPLDLVLLDTSGNPYTTLDTTNVAAHQANSTAPDVATLVTNFNALLAKLQAAGLMAAS